MDDVHHLQEIVQAPQELAIIAPPPLRTSIQLGDARVRHGLGESGSRSCGASTWIAAFLMALAWRARARMPGVGEIELVAPPTTRLTSPAPYGTRARPSPDDGAAAEQQANCSSRGRDKEVPPAGQLRRGAGYWAARNRSLRLTSRMVQRARCRYNSLGRPLIAKDEHGPRSVVASCNRLVAFHADRSARRGRIADRTRGA